MSRQKISVTLTGFAWRGLAGVADPQTDGNAWSCANALSVLLPLTPAARNIDS